MSDDEITLLGMTLKLAVVQCPGCGEELKVKTAIALTPDTGRASTCPKCRNPLLLWAEEIPDPPASITPLPRRPANNA